MERRGGGVSEDIATKLVELMRVLQRIEQRLASLKARSTREWIALYYDGVRKIPDKFTAEEWSESEQVVYDSIVQEINGDFSERGMFDSGMRKKLLEILEKERKKLLKARRTKT